MLQLPQMVTPMISQVVSGAVVGQVPSGVGAVHRVMGWYAVWAFAAVGVWGIVLAVARREPGRAFAVAFGIATVMVIAQVLLGLWVRSSGVVEPGDQHTFYGIVILFTFAFAYIYRAQMRRRPALLYGLLALFVMGLGLRAIGTFGRGF